MKLRLISYPNPDRIAEVSFRQVPHYAASNDRLRAYEVTVDGVVVGKVYAEERTCETRSRGARYVNRRWKGTKPQWKADGKIGREESRADAAARLVGFSRAERMES